MRSALVAILLVLTATAHAETVRKGRFRYELFVPSTYSPTEKWPLIVALHWSGGRGARYLKVWKKVAEQEGLIMAFPNAADRLRWTHVDEGRVLEMVRDLQRRFKIDDDAIFLTGHSAGGGFAYHLLLVAPHVFKGAAVVSGVLYRRDRRLLQPAEGHQPHICIVHGKRDEKIPVAKARRDRALLRRAGYEVNYHELRGLGHWHPPKITLPLWQCLSKREAAVF